MIKHSKISTPEQILEHLRTVPIFSKMNTSELESISRQITWKRFKKGDTVIEMDNSDKTVMVLLFGSARIKVLSIVGKEVTLWDISDGELFGDFSAIDGQRRSAEVLALSDCLVGQIKAHDFLQLVTSNPILALAEMQRLTKTLRQLTKTVVDWTSLSAAQRVQSLLLQLGTSSNEYPEWLVVSDLPSQTEIANKAFTQREVVSREISRLEKAGVLRRLDSRCVLVKKTALDLSGHFR